MNKYEIVCDGYNSGNPLFLRAEDHRVEEDGTLKVFADRSEVFQAAPGRWSNVRKIVETPVLNRVVKHSSKSFLTKFLAKRFGVNAEDISVELYGQQFTINLNGIVFYTLSVGDDPNQLRALAADAEAAGLVPCSK